MDLARKKAFGEGRGKITGLSSNRRRMSLTASMPEDRSASRMSIAMIAASSMMRAEPVAEPAIFGLGNLHEAF